MLLYIDIAAVGFIIPSVAGVAAVVGGWLYFHFKRTKSKVSKKLGIDENAGNEVEGDIIINDEDQAAVTPEENAVNEAEEENKD